jgi:hypothetical protein
MTLTMSSMIRVFLHQNLVTFPKIRNILFAGIVSKVYRFGILILPSLLTVLTNSRIIYIEVLFN